MTSLRSSAAYRIAFTYAAAFAVAVLLLGVAVYFAADLEFRRQRDQSIAEELADLARERNPAELLDEINRREATDTFGYALFDKEGRRIAGGLDTRRPDIGFSRILFQDPVEGPDVARAKAVDLLDQGLSLFCQQVTEHHSRTFLGEEACGLCADARRTPSDHGNLAIEESHTSRLSGIYHSDDAC